jgi:hypothetical protein
MAERNAPAAGESNSDPVATPMFSPEQLHSMADHEVNAGRLTREQANEMLAADGVQPQAQPTEEQKAYDALYPRASAPTDYEMPLMDPALDSKTAAAFDKAARGWLYEAGFDRGRGTSLLREVDRVAQQHASMSDTDKKLYQTREREKLTRMWGDKTREKLGLARQLVQELEAKSPGLMDILEAGPGNSAMVIALIAAQAEILANRPGRK